MPLIRRKCFQAGKNANECAGRGETATIEDLERRLFLSATFATPVYGGNLSSGNGIATADLNGDGSQDVIVI
ncbi:MAG TPA: VCBS repeat-containing protein, partial [Tepidisphaeraceae bacterium]|nr:VCBS repeat-containing protein [Tepidisphaeraceae bacterium]